LNVAVIGVGNMGKNHARIYSEHPAVKLIAVCDANKTICDEIANKYSCKAYYDVDTLLQNEKLDGVSIAVNTTHHKEVVTKVAEKRINILLEKPVASNLNDAIEIKSIVKKNGVKCVVGHIERYNPSVRLALQMVIDGKLGKLFYINAIRQGLYNKGNSDVDVLTDLGIHDLEIINYLLSNINDTVVDTKLEGSNFINKNNYDIVRVLLKTNKKTIVNLITDVLTPTKIRKLYIGGEKGQLILDYINQELIFNTNGDTKQDYSYNEILMGISQGEKIEIKIDKKEPLFLELDNFINCILDKEKPFVSIDDAVSAIELLERINKN